MFAISRSEIRQILGAINLTKYPFGKRDYLLILFGYSTALRVGEISGLTIGMVDNDREPRQYLHLPAAISKGSRGRLVPLNAKAQECVQKLLTFYNQIGFSTAPDAPLFQHRKGGRLSVRSIQKLVALYRDAAGLDVRATPHTLRHAAASHMIAAGVPTVHVQRILGHRKLSSTNVYCHPHQSELLESTRVLE